MTGVDFLRLMNLADRRELRMGERIIGQGDRHHHMHLVKVGSGLSRSAPAAHPH